MNAGPSGELLEKLNNVGFVCVRTSLEPVVLQSLRDTLFAAGEAGTRCLLDHPLVQTVAIQLRGELTSSGLLPGSAVAVQAIAFDKTPETNWKVPWHQDLMFPIAAGTPAEGFSLPCLKDGISYARPPQEVLESLTAVRLHLDDCDETNGPLRISPVSHQQGIVPSGDIAAQVAKFGEVTCPAREGEVLLMKVLALHASSQASKPGHRRVLHLVYDGGAAGAGPWHRMV